MSLRYTIIADFDFEKLSNTNCTYEDEAFESLVTAKDKCRSNKQCAGVFQRNCSDDNHYYICLKNKTISSDFQIEGCLHYKFPIGKYLHRKSFGASYIIKASFGIDYVLNLIIM